MVDRSVIAQNLRNLKVIEGIKKRLAGSASVVIGGVSYTPAALIAVFQTEVDATSEATMAEALYHQAVRKRRAAGKAAHPVRIALRRFALVQYGDSHAALGDFGFAPDKKTTKSVKVLVAAADKAKATRAARGTMGKKQRKKVKAPPPAT
jgi:hypothetical protein